MTKKRAVILLSGGLDSTTTLAIAGSEGYECYALSFNYGQRSQAEFEAAARIAKLMRVKKHKVMAIDLSTIGGSALTDHSIAVPEQPTEAIPSTYVPARNSIFLSVALGWAEVLSAYDIFLGANVVDYSNYPDCRPEYLEAFEQMANLATRMGVQGRAQEGIKGQKRFKIHAPLLQSTKAEIIQKGLALSIDYSQTVTCYDADPNGRACGRCDACRFRAKGFAEAGKEDPTRYQLG